MFIQEYTSMLKKTIDRRAGGWYDTSMTTNTHPALLVLYPAYTFMAGCNRTVTLHPLRDFTTPNDLLVALYKAADGQMITAVKAIRTVTGLPFVDAKNIWDEAKRLAEPAIVESAVERLFPTPAADGPGWGDDDVIIPAVKRPLTYVDGCTCPDCADYTKYKRNLAARGK